MPKISATPAIGILTVPDEVRQFRGNRNNFIDIIQSGHQLGIPVFVVTTKDLHLQQHRIPAYEYDPDSQTWKHLYIPLPNVIYNRIPQREDEHQPEVKQLIEACIKHPFVHFYNPYFFNKWQLFEWLAASPATKSNIPLTNKYNAKLKLLPLLKNYPFLYLKPERGKAGKGIMRIRRSVKSKPIYVLTVQENRRSLNLSFPTIPLLRKHINSIIGDEAYIVQQGVELSAINQRPFDLRVLVQKNKTGRWTVSGIGARIAGEKSITTHVPRGGSIENPERLLKACFGTMKSRRILSRTRKTALRFAKRIEKSSGHTMGEMSMDLGIDRRGKLWFFEANSKPMKFDEPDIRQKSLQHFFDYCKYLANKRKVRVRKKLARR